MVDGDKALLTSSLLHIEDHGKSVQGFHHQHAIIRNMGLPTECSGMSVLC
jgi:hypothetical protein